LRQFVVGRTAIEVRPGPAPNRVIVRRDAGSMVSRIDEHLNHACDARLGPGG